jgi:hypothetical protein
MLTLVLPLVLIDRLGLAEDLRGLIGVAVAFGGDESGKTAK